MVNVEWSGGVECQGDLGPLANHDGPGRELVEHLVQDNELLKLVEEEVAHGASVDVVAR